MVNTITEFFKMAVIGFEAIAVLVLILGGILAMGKFLRQMLKEPERRHAYRDFRQSFDRSLLLALDLLVAADIILTVTLELSFETLGMLGLIVLIRTFLPWCWNWRLPVAGPGRAHTNRKHHNESAFRFTLGRTDRVDNPILHHFVAITIFSLMLSMGINHTFEDVSHIWRDSGLLLRSLLAVVVLVPVVVALILWTMGLPIAVAAGLVVLAASAGAPMTYKRTQMAGGDPIYAISLQLTLALLAVMITPMTLAVFYTLFELPIARVTPFHIALQVGEVTFLPVIAGLLLRRFLPKLAEVIGKPVKVLANILFVILALVLIALLVVAPDVRAMVNVGRMPVAAIMVMVAGGLVLGHLLGGHLGRNGRCLRLPALHATSDSPCLLQVCVTTRHRLYPLSLSI